MLFVCLVAEPGEPCRKAPSSPALSSRRLIGGSAGSSLRQLAGRWFRWSTAGLVEV